MTDFRTIPREAILHATESYPDESCGVVVDGKYYRCRNDATNSTDHFVVNAEDYSNALENGELQAVIHSHCDYPAKASEADVQGCLESDVPWGIISVSSTGYKAHAWFKPEDFDRTPLIGRSFFHGVHDCLSIILDYYKREKGIDLGIYDREDNWWNEGKDHYRELLPKAGFRRIDPSVEGYQNGDVILMQMRSPVPNHAAIFLEDGKLVSETCASIVPCVILHHMYGQLSRRDVYGGYYLEKTVSVWRYGPSNN